MMKHPSISLDLSEFREKGLYLFFQDGSILKLTEGAIESTASAYWADPSRIPLSARKAPAFGHCDICTAEDSDAMCFSLRPILPFLDIIDRYFSYDRVIAIFKGDEDEVIHMAETSMQNALQYVSILCLTSYCKAGRKYSKYFRGVIPIMNAGVAAERLYLNVHWLHKGDRKAITEFVTGFKDDMMVASASVVRRLQLICKSDAFVNAFVNVQSVSEFLTLGIEETLASSFSSEGPL